MKSLIKKFANTELGILIRNTVNFKPIIMDRNIPVFSSVSDAFAWRTDNSFITKFK